MSSEEETTSGESADATAPRLFTQDEVDKIVSRNRARVERKLAANFQDQIAEIKSMIAGQPAEDRDSGNHQTQPAVAPRAESSGGAFDEIRFFRALERESVSRGVQLGESAERRIAEAYRTEKPKDASQWIASYFDEFGMSPKKQESQTQSEINGRSAPPASNIVAPSHSRSLESRSVRDMSSEEIMDTYFGTAKGRREFLQKLSHELRGTRIVAGDDRRRK
jgi:hypothetical protein